MLPTTINPLVMPLATKASASGSTGIDLYGTWNSFWTALAGSGSSFGTLTKVLGIFGFCIMLGAAGKWFMDRRRGGGGGGQGTLMAFLFGLVVSTPDVLIPIALLCIDALANGFQSFISNAT